jgi:predicted site-specific integrase-resolvase
MVFAEHVAGSLVTEVEAAGILRVSLTSLRRWRRQGRGPVYRKLNRAVRYRPEDLMDFIASARRTSTTGAAQ